MGLDISNFSKPQNDASEVPVGSVFGRVGAVAANAGDYTAAQVTNAADKGSASPQSFTGSVQLGGSTLLDLSSAGTTAVSTGSGVGDKLSLFSSTYGFGLQSARTVAFVPSGAAFSVRTASGTGQASSGADAITLFANGTAIFTGSLSVSTPGSGLLVKEGANAKQGTATLAAGTVTVPNTSVTATSRIFLTTQTPGGTVGAPYVSARTAGTSFAITSTSAADTSVVAYQIFEPA